MNRVKTEIHADRCCLSIGVISNFAGLATILIDRGLIPREAETEAWCRKHKLRGVCDQCKERSAFDPDREGRSDCCMRRMLASQPDFVAQKNRITELLESEGFLVIYVPKFHPELNRTSHPHLLKHPKSVLTPVTCAAIERVWSATKSHLREIDDLTYAQLKLNMDHALYRIPVQEIRGYILKSIRFMSVYEFINTGPLAELVVKRFKSHRGVCKSDLAVYCSELESKLETVQESKEGDLVAERAWIERYLPELRAVIAAEGEGSAGQELSDAVALAAEAREEVRVGKKRRADESAQKELERDRERKAKKRRLAKEKAAAAEDNGTDRRQNEDREE